MTVLNLNEWLGVTEAGIKIFEDSDWKEERAEDGQFMRISVCYEEILKEKKRPLSSHNSVFDFFKSSSATRALPLVLLNTGDDDPDDPPTYWIIE
jgi:hypothetical protein